MTMVLSCTVSELWRLILYLDSLYKTVAEKEE